MTKNLKLDVAEIRKVATLIDQLQKRTDKQQTKYNETVDTIANGRTKAEEALTANDIKGYSDWSNAVVKAHNSIAKLKEEYDASMLELSGAYTAMAILTTGCEVPKPEKKQKAA